MNFQEFAAAHGLIVKHVEFGRWVRVATTDKARHKNGSYKHMGDVAFVQNHATMPERIEVVTSHDPMRLKLPGPENQVQHHIVKVMVTVDVGDVDGVYSS